MDADLVNALVGLGTAVVSLLTFLLSRVLTRSAKKIKNDYAQGVVLRTRDAVTQAILAVKQSYVDNLRDLNADGQITKDEASEANRRALRTAKSYLGRKGLAELAKIAGGGAAAEAILGTEVEAQLAKVKADEKKQ